MCLAVPGRVIRVWETDTTRMAEIDLGGLRREVSAAFVPDLEAGDYTIVHVGFALQKLDEQAARESIALFAGLGEFSAPGQIVEVAP
jgi:hydrogenase expression/formation protein HypC